MTQKTDRNQDSLPFAKYGGNQPKELYTICTPYRKKMISDITNMGTAFTYKDTNGEPIQDSTFYENLTPRQAEIIYILTACTYWEGKHDPEDNLGLTRQVMESYKRLVTNENFANVCEVVALYLKQHPKKYIYFTKSLSADATVNRVLGFYATHPFSNKHMMAQLVMSIGTNGRALNDYKETTLSNLAHELTHFAINVAMGRKGTLFNNNCKPYAPGQFRASMKYRHAIEDDIAHLKTKFGEVEPPKYERFTDQEQRERLIELENNIELAKNGDKTALNKIFKAFFYDFSSYYDVSHLEDEYIARYVETLFLFDEEVMTEYLPNLTSYYQEIFQPLMKDSVAQLKTKKRVHHPADFCGAQMFTDHMRDRFIKLVYGESPVELGKSAAPQLPL